MIHGAIEDAKYVQCIFTHMNLAYLNPSCWYIHTNFITFIAFKCDTTVCVLYFYMYYVSELFTYQNHLNQCAQMSLDKQRMHCTSNWFRTQTDAWYLALPSVWSILHGRSVKWCEQWGCPVSPPAAGRCCELSRWLHWTSTTAHTRESRKMTEYKEVDAIQTQCCQSRLQRMIYRHYFILLFTHHC